MASPYIRMEMAGRNRSADRKVEHAVMSKIETRRCSIDAAVDLRSVAEVPRSLHTLQSSWPDLIRPSTGFSFRDEDGVDARTKSGHDKLREIEDKSDSSEHVIAPNGGSGSPDRFGLVARFRAIFATWAMRSRDRRWLARLSDRDLRDMRMSRFEVQDEAAKPFWRA